MPSPPRGRWRRDQSRDDRRAELRAAVLAATADAARDVATTSVESIVARAGVGRNTFYEMFRDADDAVLTVRLIAAHALLHALSEGSSSERTPRERFRSIAAAWVSCAAKQGPFTGALLARNDAPDGPLSKLRAGASSVLAAALTDAQRAGATGQTPDAIRLGLIGGMFETAARLANQPDVDQDKLAATLADLVLRGLR